MGMDSTAYLGYGFKITNKKLIEKINEGDELDFSCIEGKDFELVFGGSSYGDENDEQVYLCIKKSVISKSAWENPKAPLKQEKLIPKFDWNAMLLEVAKKHKIAKPKIGWWLIASLS